MPAPVFLVHQKKDIRDPLLADLAAAGHEAVGAFDPMTALDTVENDTRIRVLITQVNFGGGTLNGVALARMLRHKRPGIRVVFVGAPEESCYVKGVGVFFPDPPDRQTLIDEVKLLLAVSD